MPCELIHSAGCQWMYSFWFSFTLLFPRISGSFIHVFIANVSSMAPTFFRTLILLMSSKHEARWVTLIMNGSYFHSLAVWKQFFVSKYFDNCFSGCEFLSVQHDLLRSSRFFLEAGCTLLLPLSMCGDHCSGGLRTSCSLSSCSFLTTCRKAFDLSSTCITLERLSWTGATFFDVSLNFWEKNLFDWAPHAKNFR